MRKMLIVLVGLVMALGLTSSASASGRYPATPPGAAVSATAVGGGGTVTFTAGRFGRGATVTVTVRRGGGGNAAGEIDVIASGGSRLGAGVVVVQAFAVSSSTVVADDAGNISATVTLPRAEGSYEIVASGMGADGKPRTVSATVLVDNDAGKNGANGSNGANGANGSNGADGSSRAALARTGVDNVATVAWAGSGVLVLGGLLVTVASGRRRTRESV